jgi:phosphoesterase RecJ-like protein
MTINIDHHISNTHFGNISLIDSTSASTSLMVYDLLLAYDPSKIDTEIANAILMGTLTDTGAFQNLNTDPKTLRITASLIEK